MATNVNYESDGIAEASDSLILAKQNELSRRSMITGSVASGCNCGYFTRCSGFRIQPSGSLLMRPHSTQEDRR